MSIPPRASLEALLQAAVAERDTSAALRLADQLVHRRGVVALEQLLAGSLAQLQGPDAVAWLRGVVFGAAVPAGTRGSEARPSLQLVPPQLRERPVSPAPTPSALRALRAWLPESELSQAS